MPDEISGAPKRRQQQYHPTVHESVTICVCPQTCRSPNEEAISRVKVAAAGLSFSHSELSSAITDAVLPRCRCAARWHSKRKNSHVMRHIVPSDLVRMPVSQLRSYRPVDMCWQPAAAVSALSAPTILCTLPAMPLGLTCCLGALGTWPLCCTTPLSPGIRVTCRP